MRALLGRVDDFADGCHDGYEADVNVDENPWEVESTRWGIGNDLDTDDEMPNLTYEAREPASSPNDYGDSDSGDDNGSTTTRRTVAHTTPHNDLAVPKASPRRGRRDPPVKDQVRAAKPKGTQKKVSETQRRNQRRKQRKIKDQTHEEEDGECSCEGCGQDNEVEQTTIGMIVRTRTGRVGTVIQHDPTDELLEYKTTLRPRLIG